MFLIKQILAKKHIFKEKKLLPEMGHIEASAI